MPALSTLSRSLSLSLSYATQPPTLTPESGRLRHTLSSLSLLLPIPDPPSAQDVQLPDFVESPSHFQSAGLDSIVLKASSPQNVNTTHRTLDTSTPDPPADSDDGPPSSSDATSFTSATSLPAPSISYESLLDLTHTSPNTAPRDERYSPPPEFFDTGCITALAETVQQENRIHSDETTSSLSKASEGLGSCGQSPESSILDSDISDGIVAGSDEDLPKLFEPSSPIHIGGNYILPDIMEENEPEESESEFNSAETPHRGDSQGEEEPAVYVRDGEFDVVQVDIQEAVLLEGVEYIETNFSDNLENVQIEKNATSTAGRSTLSTSTALSSPPSLPISPPPGPMLSPRLSLVLNEGLIPDLEITESHTEDAPSSSALNRLSTISTTDDVLPPPLPSSLPPGKLISPRHSMIESQGMISGGVDFAAGNSGGLDMSSLIAHMDSLIQERGAEPADMRMDTPEEGNVEEEMKQVTNLDELEEQNEAHIEDTIAESGVENTDILLLPPPLATADEETPFKGSKLKVTPSFLRTLEPPVEFSDSGFPDTDTENTPGSTHKVSSGRKTRSLADKGQIASKHFENVNELLPTLPLHENSLAISDEQLTEYSGSVGLKTTASSGSLVR